MRVALGYHSRVGKDTIAAYLEANYKFRIVRFAQPLYEICSFAQETLGQPQSKDPSLMQKMADLCKDRYGQDVFVKRAMEEIDQMSWNENIVVVDLRFLNEAEELKKRGFVLWSIDRANRPRDRDQTHSSETELSGYVFDVTVSNNDTIDNLLSKVDGLLETI